MTKDEILKAADEILTDYQYKDINGDGAIVLMLMLIIRILADNLGD